MAVVVFFCRVRLFCLPRRFGRVGRVFGRVDRKRGIVVRVRRRNRTDIRGPVLGRRVADRCGVGGVDRLFFVFVVDPFLFFYCFRFVCLPRSR